MDSVVPIAGKLVFPVHKTLKPFMSTYAVEIVVTKNAEFHMNNLHRTIIDYSEK